MTRRYTLRGMLWRGDLVAALLAEGDAAAALVAQNLGMVLTEHSVEEPIPFEIDSGGLDLSVVEINSDSPEVAKEATFWQPFRYESRAQQEVPAPEGRWEWRDPPEGPPEFIPIAPKRAVLPRLRTAVGNFSSGSSLDLPKIVGAVTRLEPLHELPRKQQRRWGQNIVVVFDRSDRLTPLFEDQRQLYRQLTALTADRAITLVSTHDPDDDFVCRSSSGEYADWTFTTPSRIVVLSDLGVLQSGGSGRLQSRWAHWGRKLADQGCSLVGLVPFPAQAASSELRQAFTLVPWQQSAQQFVQDQTQRSLLVEQLLVAASPVVRLEPGLLRKLRRLIPEALDASLEVDFWQHPLLTSRHPIAASLDREALEKQAVPAFAQLPGEMRANILSAIRSWRYQFRNSPEVWFQEVLNLDQESQRLLPNDVQDAVAGFNHLAAHARSMDEASLHLREYGGQAASWLSEAAWNNPRIRIAVHDLFAASPFQTNREIGGLDPALIPPQGSPLQITLSQVGDDFQFSTDRKTDDLFMATLNSSNGWVEVTSGPLVVDRDTFWKSGSPPVWAKDWGRDEYGAWVTFEVARPKQSAGEKTETASTQPITQRMRWIPPGRFMMGSPESEPGRDSDEGPQHEVTLTRGFWMFDTPVTQELWQAVMKENPSRFLGEKNPVDSVTWNDCQLFLGQIGSTVPGLSLSLPNEAQWEYACRAGTQSLYWFGDPAKMDEHAWYGSNSQGTTHPVAKWPRNRWGLFDMHGNVWEWCHNVGVYTKVNGQTHDSVWREHFQVMRGGSWYCDQRRLRSAYRFNVESRDRDSDFGLRCVLFQIGAEPSVSPKRGGGAVARRVDVIEPALVQIPSDRIISVRTDVDGLELHSFTKPNWASKIGRDQYGLWSEFTFAAKGAEPVIQRMRWIPPGRFQMRTPKGELDRYTDWGPTHPVTLSHGYWMFDTPVTLKLWEAVMVDRPSPLPVAKRYVSRVSWNSCKEFLNTINSSVENLKLLLPTEAEWEYAYRAGLETTYSGHERDDDDEDVDEWYYPNPNTWGVRDLHSSPMEWCEDYWSDQLDDSDAVNPGGPSQGHDRVVRGRSRYYENSSDRFQLDPDDLDVSIGFRCVQVHPDSRSGR